MILGLVITGVAWLTGKFMPPVWLSGLCLSWALISSSIGIVLAVMWLFTDHEVAKYNANLLLFNPLIVLALLPVMRRVVAVILGGGIVVAYVLLLLPTHQYNLDLLVLLTPVNLAVALYFLRRP